MQNYNIITESPTHNMGYLPSWHLQCRQKLGGFCFAIRLPGVVSAITYWSKAVTTIHRHIPLSTFRKNINPKSSNFERAHISLAPNSWWSYALILPQSQLLSFCLWKDLSRDKVYAHCGCVCILSYTSPLENLIMISLMKLILIHKRKISMRCISWHSQLVSLMIKYINKHICVFTLLCLKTLQKTGKNKISPN